MKNKLLLSLLLGFGPLIALAKSEPVPPASEDPEPARNANTGIDPFASSGQALSLPKMVQVQVEFIELPHKALTKLLFLAEPKTSDGTVLRKKLQEMVEKDEAEVLETQLVVAKTGKKITTESIHEFIYPTEYEPPGLPCGDPHNELTPRSSIAAGEHALPTAFDTRNLGSTIEVESSFPNSADERLVELRLIPELVWHTGTTIWVETKDLLGNISKVQMPEIYVLRLNNVITCVAGQYTMVSVLSPKDSKGETDMTRKVMVFVKCDVLSVK